MEMSPKAIAAVTFPVVRKGYDPEQVRSFLSQLSRGVEELQNRALQAEAKARLTTTAPPPDPANMESITKTLLLAQRTADATLVEARDEAEGIRRQASERAESILAEAKAQRTQIIAAAEQEALRVGEVTRGQVAAEVDALELRRSALSDDADALSAHVLAQRERLAVTVGVLSKALEGPESLQTLERPALSAASEAAPVLVAPATETAAGTAAPTSAGGATPAEPPATELLSATGDAGTKPAGSSSGFPAPESASASGLVETAEPMADPITQEVPLVGEREPQAWSFFDDEPKGDDRWKR